MQFDPMYRPDVIAATMTMHDHPRDLISITRWRGRAVAMATNGFALCVTPVELDDEDVTGFLTAEQFARARKVAKKRGTLTATLSMRNDFIVFDDKWVSPRARLISPYGEFPNVLRIVDMFVAPRETITTIALSPTLLQKAVKVLGGGPGDGLRIYMSKDANSPVLLRSTSAGGAAESVIDPPFVMIAPMMTKSLPEHTNS